MVVYEVGGANVPVDECTSGANFLYFNQEKRHDSLEGWILTILNIKR